MDDLCTVLGPNVEDSRGDLNRPSLALQTMWLPRRSERLAWLAAQVPALPGHGIIYTRTVRNAVQVAQWLQSRGLAVESYTGETGDLREELDSRRHANLVPDFAERLAMDLGLPFRRALEKINNDEDLAVSGASAAGFDAPRARRALFI